VLVRLAVTLTAEPWALTPEIVQDAASQGLDDAQIEAAVGVISMFNYFTRVADATGIEFDYLTPLPAFRPDLRQATAPRPERSAATGRRAVGRRPPRHPPLRAAWDSWRTYVLESDQPLSRPERRLLASIAAEESADWDRAEALGGSGASADDDGPLVRFARKLSRQPWRMEAGDLQRLRSSGYSEVAILHIVSVVAHQNADSRLAAGLSAVS